MVILLVISALVGVAAVVVASMLLNRQQAVKTTQVVVAAKPIEAQTKLGPDHLTVAQWPQGKVPTGAKTNPSALVDRLTNTKIAPGEIVLEGHLTTAEVKGGLSDSIAQGKRAVALAVSEVGDVAGFALPGNYVDILLSGKDPAGQSYSKIILERVLILAVAQDRTVKDPTKPKVANIVTIELTPQEAERLDMARSVGTLSLALRNQSDRTPASAKGSTQEELSEQRPMIEVIRGMERVMEKGSAN